MDLNTWLFIGMTLIALVSLGLNVVLLGKVTRNKVGHYARVIRNV